MYLSEIAPVSLRGLCGVFNQLSITFGVLMSQVIGLNEVLGKKHTWQFALGILGLVIKIQCFKGMGLQTFTCT